MCKYKRARKIATNWYNYKNMPQKRINHLPGICAVPTTLPIISTKLLSRMCLKHLIVGIVNISSQHIATKVHQ